MTAIRSVSCEITARSWLTRIIPEPQHLRLRPDIERGGGLIGDNEGGREHQGHGDGDALALPARQLVGQPVELDAAQAGSIERFARERSCVGRAHRTMQGDRLGDLIADAHQRIQCRHRLLKDHADACAAHAAQLLLAHRVEQPILEMHRSGRACPARQQAHDGEGRHGFSRPRRADQP
jgi:hypothetical protein